MPIQVLMPRLGESVDEGTITKWLKAQGDPIAQYEALLEVNTDKVDSEIPSPEAGVLLEILLPEGSIAQVGMPLAWIGAAGEAVPGGDQPAPAIAPGENQPVPEVASAITATAPFTGSPPAAVPGAGQDRDAGLYLPDRGAHRPRTKPGLKPGTGHRARRADHQAGRAQLS